MKRFFKQAQAGFTLIELLVVVSIIAILSIVVITNLNSARAKARDAQISTNLKEMDTAASLMVSNNDLPLISPSPSNTGTSGFASLLDVAHQKGYLGASATPTHPVTGRNYEASYLITGASLSYRFCALLDDGTHWYVNENGSVTTTGTTDACQSVPPAQQ